MNKLRCVLILLSIVGFCNAQDIEGIWQYGDSIYAAGKAHYIFSKAEVGNSSSFKYTPSRYDELRSFVWMDGRCILKKESIVFYVKSVTFSFQSDELIRRNKKDSIPYYAMELYYDTVMHSMEKRNWPSLTNYWTLKGEKKCYDVKYNPPLCFDVPYTFYKEGTFDVLEIDGDKFYYVDPSPDDFGEQIDNRDEE